MKTTGIEWTDSTWNPLRGCSRVSEGCRNCYAEKVAYRFSGAGRPYEGLAVLKNGHASWTGKVELVEKHLLNPLRWGRVPILRMRETGPVGFRAIVPVQENFETRPRRIFVNSMSDLFHENVPDEWIDRIFAVMALCPQHVFQVLTKRPERMREYCSSDAALGRLMRFCATILDGIKGSSVQIKHRSDGLTGFALPNVWLGVSVENQPAADERIPLLLQTPAAVRFLSCEPLLGPITFRPRCESLEDKLHAMEHGYASRPMDLVGIDWLICGGESGPGARPMHPDWARSLRDQCQAAGVPFFFKQWGEWREAEEITTAEEKASGTSRTYRAPDGLEAHGTRMPKLGESRFLKVGKHAAGALLDGREWREFPGAPRC